MNDDMIKRAYEALSDATPLTSDCGLLCARACCEGDFHSENGVFLFPGEAESLKGEPWASICDSPFAFGGLTTPLLKCDGNCARDKRPFACRFFPLTPYKAGPASPWNVRMDRRAWAVCPLMRCGTRGLHPAFIAAARVAVRVIASDPEGERFLSDWQTFEESFAITL